MTLKVSELESALCAPIQPCSFEQELNLVKINSDINQSVDRRLQESSQQISDLRADIIEKVEKKTLDSIGEPWAPRLMKGMDSTKQVTCSNLTESRSRANQSQITKFLISTMKLVRM